MDDLLKHESWEMFDADRRVTDRKRRLHVNRIRSVHGNQGQNSNAPPKKKESRGGHIDELGRGMGGGGKAIDEDQVEIVADKQEEEEAPSSPPPGPSNPSGSQRSAYDEARDLLDVLNSLGQGGEGNDPPCETPQETQGEEQETQQAPRENWDSDAAGNVPESDDAQEEECDLEGDGEGEGDWADDEEDDPEGEFSDDEQYDESDDDPVKLEVFEDTEGDRRIRHQQDLRNLEGLDFTDQRGEGMYELGEEGDDWSNTPAMQQLELSATDKDALDALEKLNPLRATEKGHRSGAEEFKITGEKNNEEVFRVAKCMMKRFVTEEDFSVRDPNVRGKVDFRFLVKKMIARQYDRIYDRKWIHPLINNVLLMLDVSGSCVNQAEMFMTIGSAVIGDRGITTLLSFNGQVDTDPISSPNDREMKFNEALRWARETVRDYNHGERFQRRRERSGKETDYDDEGVPLDKYLLRLRSKPSVVIIFGDYDGIDIYERCMKAAGLLNVKFFWFCNEFHPHYSMEEKRSRWEKGTNFLPGIMEPKNFITAIRSLL